MAENREITFTHPSESTASEAVIEVNLKLNLLEINLTGTKRGQVSYWHLN